ncbi:MAG: hypothetical protein OXF63_10140 [Anaerolineaceae bacterium]|nr:hypothetical protein [Anaerolineaceae bacterium]
MVGLLVFIDNRCAVYQLGRQVMRQFSPELMVAGCSVDTCLAIIIALAGVEGDER